MILPMTPAESMFDNPEAAAALNAACRRFGVVQLDVFGSAATGHNFDPARSDLDVLVAFEPQPPISYADAYFGLREVLETLSGRPVDLLTEPALENPYLRERIFAERRSLYSAR